MSYMPSVLNSQPIRGSAPDRLRMGPDELHSDPRLARPPALMPAKAQAGSSREFILDFQDSVGEWPQENWAIDDHQRGERATREHHQTLVVLQATTLCNIRCSYCYLPERLHNRRMSPEVLRAAIDTVLASNSVPGPVMFLWHLGEPLAASPEFYENAFHFASAAAARHGRNVRHGFQTNATLLNGTWVNLIKRHNVRVGVSVDGPAFIHDRLRRSRAGLGTHAATMRGVKLLQDAGIRFGAISVITDFTLDYAREFYDFFLNHEISRVALNTDEIEGVNRHSSLAAASSETRYKQFITQLLERAECHTGAVRIRELWSTLSVLATDRVVPINTANRALRIITIDHSGDVYTFSPELAAAQGDDRSRFAIGNVLSSSLEEMTDSSRFKDLSSEIAVGVEKCRNTCQFWAFCGGGSPSNKFFEHGQFDVTETAACRVHTKATVEAVSQHVYGNARLSHSTRT